MTEGVLIKIDNILRDVNDKFIDTYFEYFDLFLTKDEHEDMGDEAELLEPKEERLKMDEDRLRFYSKTLLALKGDPEVTVDEEEGDTTLDYNYPLENLFFAEEDKQIFLEDCGHTIYGNSEVINHGAAEMLRITNNVLTPVYFIDDIKWDKSITSSLTFLVKAKLDFRGVFFYNTKEEKENIEFMFKWKFTDENYKLKAKEFDKDLESEELFIYLRTIEKELKEKLQNGNV